MDAELYSSRYHVLQRMLFLTAFNVVCYTQVKGFNACLIGILLNAAGGIFVISFLRRRDKYAYACGLFAGASMWLAGLLDILGQKTASHFALVLLGVILMVGFFRDHGTPET